MIWVLVVIFFVQHAACDQTSPSPPLYPYGPSEGDKELNYESTVPVYLGYKINFYGRKYDTIYISKDGIVGFDSHVRFEPIDFSQKDSSKDNQIDFPFLAPFNYRGLEITSRTQGHIYYRIVFTNSSQAFLRDMQYYMLNATVTDQSFVPDLALIVTWEDVTDTIQPTTSARCQGTTTSPCKSSTFQLVLTACPMQTFAIFNYLKMDVPIPSNSDYQCGINGGHGVSWTSVCPQCSNLKDLPKTRGSDKLGRFIFRVSEETVERGGCTANGDVIQILPTVAGMFGGELLDVTGPCMSGDVTVKCQFGTGQNAVTTSGFKVNYMRLKCPVPRLTQRGFVPVSIATDGQHFRGHAYILIVMPGNVPKSLTLSPQWYDKTADRLTLSWNASVLSTDPNVKVDVKVIGYRETDHEVTWKTMKTLGSSIGNTGSYSFSPSSYQCVAGECDQFEVGIIEVQLQPQFITKANSRVVMNKGVVPLGWYTNEAMVNQYGENWPQERCMKWHDADQTSTPWLDNLLPCPCTVEQALADFGRWQPDLGCSMFSTSKTNCYFHKDAHHCVRSFKPTAQSAGNQCCYNQHGLLLYAADTYEGSTPDRSHDWGAAPYSQPDSVPSLSHWIHDVVPFYYCCLWTKYSYCDYYMERRPTRDCKTYQPPKSATAYGDPHISTFDNLPYNFGGKGDYVLVKTNSDEFVLQGKFDAANQTRDGNFVYNTTVLKAVAMKGRSETRVQIQLAPTGLNSGRILDVFVDKKLKLFDSKSTFKQDFKGEFSIINTTPDKNKNQNNFTVIFGSGVGVQVSASNRLLHVVVNMPPAFRNKTKGLMGTWSGTTNDDYTASDGRMISSSSTPMEIYEQFSKTWKVTKSLFMSYDKADPNFVPQLTAPTRSAQVSQSELRNKCGTNKQCRFDYLVTGNAAIAGASKLASEWFAQLQRFQTPVQSCGLLNVPHAKKDNSNYTLGNTVSVTGCRNGGSLSGDTTYTCTLSSQNLFWSPSVTAFCSELSDEPSNAGMIAGIVVACVVVVIIVIVVAAVCYKRRTGGSRKESKKGEPEIETGQKDAMLTELKVKRETDDTANKD